MLHIVIPENEGFDETTGEFKIIHKRVNLTLEHSLVSISKWESKWKKPFLKQDNGRTNEEALDYIRCMTLTQNVPDEVYYSISKENANLISEYINDPMTATTITSLGGKKDNTIITSEVIYYWMKTLTIPFECQKWHLNRLLTFIKVCQAKDSPKKKMSKSEILSRNAALNEARRKAANSKG